MLFHPCTQQQPLLKRPIMILSLLAIRISNRLSLLNLKKFQDYPEVAFLGLKPSVPPPNKPSISSKKSTSTPINMHPKIKSIFKPSQQIASFLKKHPNIYIFIEGHTDERASEAYNLALGTRRSNCVRELLIKRGAPAKQLFTISYGKERPEVRGHNRASWAKNRRVFFKMYQRETS